MALGNSGWKNHEMKRQFRNWLTVSLCVCSLAFAGSCIKPGTSVKKDEPVKTEEQQESKPAEELVKPTLDKEQPKPEEPRQETAKAIQETPPKPVRVPKGPTRIPRRMDGEESEETQLIKVMKDLARNVGGVTLAKLCFAKEDDEWWILFYRESGGKVDLKQFIWNRHSRIPEPYLVIREFSKGRMNYEMKKNEEGKECRIIRIDEDRE